MRNAYRRESYSASNAVEKAACIRGFSAGGDTFERMNSSSAIRAISEPSYLRRAWGEISKKNKRSQGVDNVTLQAFRQNLDHNLSEISASLRSGNFKFNRLRAHAIERAGKKSRPIQIATIRDRVVMKALAMFVGPCFQAYDLECSYAFIKGRGVKSAMARVKGLIAGGNKHYFEADIINFFGSVDRQTLWKMFAAKIRHRSLLPLLQQCFELELENLESYKTEFQDLFVGADSGIPQGGMLSPMLANFYLHYFDRRLTERGFNLVRYADDFVVMCSSEQEALQAYSLSKDVLKTLGLAIHPLEPKSKSRVGYYPKDGLMFLGVRFEGCDVYPTNQVIDRFQTKVRDILKRNSGDSLFKTLQRLTNLVNGWGHCYRDMRVTQTYQRLDQFLKGAVEQYLKNLGIHLSGENRRRQLKLLGIPSLVAMVEHSAAVVGNK